ncbi:MAG TPA: hypothetical protein PKD59_08625 [Miltoncostaeaceae bacterium]|nr:hypothetical protein [Miltoncostaeaceae bacterium]
MPELALAIRPDDWNLPLFVHVLGAMVLVGGLLTCVVAIVLSRGDARLLRIGWISLLALGLPGWIAMRAGAEWIYSKEGWSGDDDPAWIGIGFITAEGGGVLLLAALICGGIGVRKLRTGGGAGLLMAVNILSVIALAAYVVAIWAMGAKPS